MNVWLRPTGPMERDTMDHVGLVSILTPCFNSAATLPRYMAGISAQTCRNFEVVFINDGSTDNTEHVFFELAQATAKNSGVRIEYVVQPNRGPCAAINAGLRVARGEYFVFCDSDDVLAPDAIAQFIKAFQENPGADMVFTRYRLCDETGKPIDYGPAPPIPAPNEVYSELLARGMFIKAGAYCFRRKCLQLLPLGRLNEQNYGQNIEILLHVAARGRVCFWDAFTVDIFSTPASRSRRRSLTALRRQTLDSKRTQLEIMRQHGVSRSVRRAFTARFLSNESLLYFLEGNWLGQTRCLLTAIWLGRLNGRIIRHWLAGPFPTLRRRLAKQWYPEYFDEAPGNREVGILCTR